MKKLWLIMAPLMTLSLLTSCQSKKLPFKPGTIEEPLKFTCLSDGEMNLNPTVKIVGKKDVTVCPYNLEYSANGISWKKVEFRKIDTEIEDLHFFTSAIKIKKGRSVYLRGDNPEGTAKDFESFTTNDKDSQYLGILGNNAESVDHSKVSLSGNIMSIMYKKDFDKITEPTTTWSLQGLFMNNNSVIDASKLLLPATKLQPFCYCSLFQDCLILTKAPRLLDNITLVDNCYYTMFRRCKNLKITTTPNEEGKIFTCTNKNACFHMFYRTMDWDDKQEMEENTTYYYVA